MKIAPLILATLFLGASWCPAKTPGDFPRLLGMNIGRKNYDDPAYQAKLARLDVVILGFPPGWNPRHEADPIGHVLRNLRQLNPAIKIGQYTILNEAYDDPKILPDADIRHALDRYHWWLRNAKGRKVQWTARYHTWEINFTQWAPPNPAGQRYPGWLAARDNRLFFRRRPGFDIWYCDNVFWRPRETADWERDGRDDSPNDPRIQAALRAGHARYWADIRKLQPGILVMGNSGGHLSFPEYRGQLDASFIEGWMGRRWSVATRRGWTAAMARYRTTLADVRPGGFVAVGVEGAVNNYRLMRYGLASCLMDDGYFCYSDPKSGYSGVPWFDEYDVPLGRAISSPPRYPWQHGVWRRDFAGGVALVNPSDSPVTVTLEPGLRRFSGKQDPAVNNGRPVTRLTVGARDGIILVRAPAGGATAPANVSGPWTGACCG